MWITKTQTFKKTTNSAKTETQIGNFGHANIDNNIACEFKTQPLYEYIIDIWSKTGWSKE